MSVPWMARRDPGGRPPRLYPAMLDLRGRTCLVVGGGTIARRKASELLRCGAFVTAVAPEWAAGFARLKGRRLRQITRAFSPGDLAGCTLAVAATDDESVQRLVSSAAAGVGILCNVVDVPGLCSFQVPAILRRGPLTVAVSTAGLSPLFAVRLRDHLMEVLEPAVTKDLLRVARARRRIRALHAHDPARRRQECLGLIPPGDFPACLGGDPPEPAHRPRRSEVQP